MSDSSAKPWQPWVHPERGNTAEQVMEDIRQRILAGHLARGEKLPAERQLTGGYGVSVATIREAKRALLKAGLIEVKHGKGAYVTASSEELIATSLRTMIELERIGIVQVLGVHGALNGYAAELAATKATREDISAMRKSLDEIDHSVTPEAIAAGLIRFLNALVEASGNPLLVALCRFLASVQIGLAKEIQGRRLEAWRKTAARLANERQRLVDAIESGDVEGARAAARAYHERSMKVITALPSASTPQVSEIALSTLFASLLQRKLA
jgi:GntR family transcriptional repressor for pyruvate dehydrogenase complex